ncbi:membrane protein [Lachnospiraceae bacterium KM106-2]|nr:membrane protein [Lachnospiraceae bacterium KM106-2]
MRKSNILWGIIFILFGSLLIVSKLGLVANVNLLTLGITVILVVVMLKSLWNLQFGGVLFPLAFIGILYDEQLGITAITPWTILVAAAFASIGLDMIFHKCKVKVNLGHHYHKNHHDPDVINIDDDSYVSQETSFGDSVKYINSNDFKRADLSCKFGGLTAYFDHAILQGDSAVVNVDCSFAGIELYFPKEWKIDIQMNAVFGGVEEDGRNTADGSKVVTLLGDVRFGGVEIHYV